MKPLLFEDDRLFASNTLRMFSHTAWGGSDIGEVVTTSGRIAAGDFESWHDEWVRCADGVAGESQRSLDGGHRISARDGFLRASNYYRSAHFFLHGRPDDPRSAHAAKQSVECFTTAGRLFEPPIEPVEIPYESTTLPGYWYPGATNPDPRPTVLMFGGFDSTGEEMHFAGAQAAADRGYRVLVFEGPGQGKVVHQRGLPFRRDWERVVTPVYDFVANRPDVDSSRVALFGSSFGGQLAPRAAAFEQRLAAVIAHCGVYDLARAIVAVMPTDDDEARDLMAVVPMARWLFEHGMYVTGTSSPSTFVDRLKEFSLSSDILGKVSCPGLVCNDLDDRIKGQPQEVYDQLTCEKTFLEFTAEDGADEHCQAGASRLAYARIFNWLDEILDHRSD